MVFDKKASILTLADEELTFIGEEPQHRYLWNPSKSVWVHMEHQNKSNLFSKVGIGVKTVIFTLRKTSGIDLHSAIAYSGQQYFITDINRDDPMLMVVTTADIQPAIFTARGVEEQEGEYKSAVYVSKQDIRFPACLTEKYLGFKQEAPMARTEETFVLVTPKPVLLDVHDIVRPGLPPRDGEDDKRPAYAVKVCHFLDEYKNEYEITSVGDV